ncbi:hypothetical protein KIH24_13385 [Rhizobiales bacterium TNE-4]|nr:hypothetical protein [Rhizobiales bacterium TNE-4]MBV1828611.1 hypothetical protein [Rhizobiales bacterium TNE-4]
MRHPRYNSVILLCPIAATGGPEAIHQLAQIINENGGCAELVYFDNNSNLFIGPDHIITNPTLSENFVNHFRPYNPRRSDIVHFDDNCLVVFPELYALLASEFRGAQKAVWWLSIDNFTDVTPLFQYASVRESYFSDQSILHFYQSDYARSYLLANKASRLAPLFDFIPESYILQEVELPTVYKQRRVAFFPQKGQSLAKLFIETAPDLDFIPIQNMTRNEVSETLKKSWIYIDFGHHPGKDRVPREAAASGCLILLHHKGAALHYNDHPLSDDFLFTYGDIISGELASRVRRLLEKPADHLLYQLPYRQKIRCDHAEFLVQVRNIFFND